MIVVRTRELRDRALKLVADIRPDADRPMEVIIRPYKADKTAEQRGWFHKLCEFAGEAYSVPAWKVKEAVKEELFGKEVVRIGGKTREVTRSSESLNRKEYSDLIETLYRMAAEDGIILPMTYAEQAAYDDAVGSCSEKEAMT